MAYGGGTNMDILSDEVFDFMCRVCKRKGKNCEAEKYCEECGDYFCSICVKVHDDIPSLTVHTILGKAKFPKGPSTKDTNSKSRPDAPAERCDKHSHHFIDMYCQNHDDVGCGTCMAMNHKLCKDTFYIPEYIEKNRRMARSYDMEQKLTAVAKSLKEHLEHFNKEKERLLKSKEATLEVIKKFRKEINDRLDELEKTTVADLEDKYAALVDIVDKGMTMFETNTAKVNKSLEVLSKDNESITQIFVNIKKSNNLSSKTINFIEENKLGILSQAFDFSADIRIMSLLKEMKALGKAIQQTTTRTEDLKDQEKPREEDIDNVKQQTTTKTEDLNTLEKPTEEGLNKVKQQTTTKTEDCKTKVAPHEEALHRTKEMKKYWVSVRADKFECSILTACIMEDGTIILAEGRNNKIKRLNGSTFALRDYCDSPGKPWQVCAIGSNQVAVTLPRKEKVLFVSLSNRMSITENITTGFQCHGLAYANGNLYISDRFTAIYQFNLTGGKLQKFTKTSPSRDMSCAIRSLAVLPDGSKVFVAGWNNGLIVLDNHGKVVGKFNGPPLDGAWDCHLTGSGSLLVSGNNSNNVVQFGVDCKLKGEVVRFADRNGSYKGFCCNKEMTKMIIGKTGDEIEVYDLT